MVDLRWKDRSPRREGSHEHHCVLKYRALAGVQRQLGGATLMPNAAPVKPAGSRGHPAHECDLAGLVGGYSRRFFRPPWRPIRRGADVVMVGVRSARQVAGGPRLIVLGISSVGTLLQRSGRLLTLGEPMPSPGLPQRSKRLGGPGSRRPSRPPSPTFRRGMPGGALSVHAALAF